MKKALSTIIVIILIASLMLIPASAADGFSATAEPDHLTLSFTGDPSTTMTFTWRTANTVDDSIVQYSLGTAFTSAGALSKTGSADAYTNDLGTANIHRVTLTGLMPASTYSYRVGDGTTWSKAYTFKTASSNPTNFSVLVFGDAQCSNFKYDTYWQVTLENAYAANPDAAFMVNMGDTAEYGGMDSYWDLFFDTSAGVMPYLPEMIVQGNHDTFSYIGGPSIYNIPVGVRTQFTTPANGPVTAEGLEKTCYSYDYGNVHFVVLDSQILEESLAIDGLDIATPQKEWLEQDLSANADAQFTVVMLHKSIYYNNSMRSNQEVKDAFMPIFDKYHVDLVLQGHDHEYARTYPMYQDSPQSLPQEGTVYITTGRSGYKTYTTASQKVWDAFYYDAQDMPTYNVLSVNGSKLIFSAYLQDGTLLDSYVIDNAGNDSTLTVPPATSTYTRLAICGNLLSQPEIMNPPYQDAGEWYVPIRTVVQHISGMVTWNAADSTVSLKTNVTAVIESGSTTATINGAPVTLQYAPVTSSGVMYVAADDLKTIISLNSQTAFSPKTFTWLPVTFTSVRYDASLNMLLLDD